MTTTTLESARSGSRRRPRRTAILFGFAATLLLALLLATAISLVVAVRSNGMVMPGVRVAGIELSGLDRSSAAQRLSAGLPSLSSGRATLVIDGETVTVPYARIGRGYELDAMLDAAFAAGRSADPLTNALDRLRLLARGEALAPLVHAYDADAVAVEMGEDGALGRLVDCRRHVSALALTDGSFPLLAGRHLREHLFYIDDRGTAQLEPRAQDGHRLKPGAGASRK